MLVSSSSGSLLSRFCPAGKQPRPRAQNTPACREPGLGFWRQRGRGCPRQAGSQALRLLMGCSLRFHPSKQEQVGNLWPTAAQKATLFTRCCHTQRQNGQASCCWAFESQILPRWSAPDPGCSTIQTPLRWDDSLQGSLDPTRSYPCYRTKARLVANVSFFDGFVFR